MTYHDYVYNPDANRHEVALLRAALERYTKTVTLRQGENGAPSSGGGGRGALWDYPWTELTQAKWDTRRMLGDLGQDIESSVFSLVEMNYTYGPINRLNYKGLLKSDASKRVIRPKIAYYAVQNVTSIFDHSLERLVDLEHTHNIAERRRRPVVQPLHGPQAGRVRVPAQGHRQAGLHDLATRQHPGGRQRR